MNFKERIVILKNYTTQKIFEYFFILNEKKLKLTNRKFLSPKNKFIKKKKRIQKRNQKKNIN